MTPPVIVVQLCSGGRLHDVFAVGDASGMTLCRRRFDAGAKIIPDGTSNCDACRKRRPG